jgi:hypothetical protein
MKNSSISVPWREYVGFLLTVMTEKDDWHGPITVIVLIVIKA